MMNRIEAAVCCGTGRIRKNNEDSFFFGGHYKKLSEMDAYAGLEENFPASNQLFAVCDGVGGARNGETASFTVAQSMEELQKMLPGRDFVETVGIWAKATNQKVREAAAGGGCTLAMIYIADNRMYIAHIGDSRVYRYVGGRLQCMTKDHSKIQLLMDAGLLMPEQAANHPQKHMITRYFGADEHEAGFFPPTVSRPMPMMDGDRYMICSDGITDMLSEAEIQQMMAETVNARACAEKIYQAALNAGGRDNTTLIVLDFRLHDDKTLDYRQDNQEDYDPFDDTLDLDEAFHESTAKAYGNRTVKMVQTYRLSDAPGKLVAIRSEISVKY